MERIISSAVRAKRVKRSEYKIVTGDHSYIHQNFATLFEFHECRAYEVEYGFILSDGSFIDRESAYRLAKLNGQLINDDNFILKSNNVKYDT